MKAPSRFPSLSAAIIAVFALSSCTKERVQDLAPLGTASEQLAPPATQDDAFQMVKVNMSATDMLVQEQKVTDDGLLTEMRPRLIHPAQLDDAGRTEGSAGSSTSAQQHMGREQSFGRPQVEYPILSRPYEHPEP